MRQIRIFDTTLRDGEQAAGGSLTLPEKMELGRQLQRLGVDIIEAGFPATSPGDFRAVEMMSRELRDCQIAALSGFKEDQIETTYRALKDAVAPRLHIVISTSDNHLQNQLHMSRQEVIEIARDATAYCKRFLSDVEFSAMDATRSDPDFLCEVFSAAVASGATVINVPDTLGYHQPPQFADLVRYVMEHVPGVENVAVSVHCHNDLGMATALSLAAVNEGAEQIECTINGVGERAGNASLEEIVMALRTRQDYYQATTNINTEQIWRASRMVSQYMGFVVQPNKAIVGANAFAHSSGLHQDGMLKERTTYEIMTPESIGRNDSRLVLGKTSGRHAVRSRLEELGFELDDDDFALVFAAFKELADKKKDVSDGDLEAIVSQHMVRTPEMYELVRVQVVTGNDSVPTATVQLRTEDEVLEDAAIGDGPVDAVVRAISRITGVEARLTEYTLQAITPGVEAQGEVTLRIASEGHTFIGRGTSTDIVVASAAAYLNAVNKVLARHDGEHNGTVDALGLHNQMNVEVGPPAEQPVAV